MCVTNAFVFEFCASIETGQVSFNLTHVIYLIIHQDKKLAKMRRGQCERCFKYKTLYVRFMSK